MTKKTFLKLSACSLILGVAATGFTTSAQAQAIPTQLQPAQGTIDPSRLEDQFQQDTVIPDLGEAVEVQRAIIQNAPANADQIKFELNNISIEGVGAYSAEQLQSIYGNQLGTTVSLADVYSIANRLTTKYRNDGFILTQVVVPPQTIDDGNVVLRVVEGYVDRVVIEGVDEEDSELSRIRSYASKVSTGDALNLKQLERALLLINDLPGVSARSVLSPSSSQAGASDLRIIVSRKDYDALLGVDNFGSRYLGAVQLTASGAANSIVFDNNEQITGQFVTAPFGNTHYELAFGALSYEQPINSYGTKARAFLSHSDTEPGYDIDIFNVKGKSTTYGFGLEHPIIRSRTQNLYANAQVDFRDVNSRSDIDVTRDDHIRALRLGARYEFIDTLFGVGINSIDVEASKGMNILGASDEGDANLTRPNGDPQFAKLNVSAQRLQRITSDVNLLLGVNVQESNNALLSSEEFGVGGASFGRGYDASEIVGDDGYSTKVELQWSNPIDTSLSAVENYNVYGFWDFGKVTNDDATISDDDESLSSVGAGVRANLSNNFEAGFYVALPLTRDVQTRDDQDPRYFFNLSRRF